MNNTSSAASDMSASEIEQMASLLKSLGIGHVYAAKYAPQLFEEGYDTPDSLVYISEQEMQELAFKKPHIRMIQQSNHENLKPTQPGEEEGSCESRRVRGFRGS